MKLFITGTDTDCGKTYVTCQLLDYFKANHQRALALKPIASGCQHHFGRLQSEDVVNLQKHNSDASLTINHWLFEPPISPHLAARAVNQSLSAAELANFCLKEEFSSFDPLLIEGAGGLMVPLNEQETWINFLQLTKIPVILVVGMRLGCLNHALLTEAVLRDKQIKTIGWIANCLDKNMLYLEENIRTLTQKMKIPLLASLPYQGKFSLEFDLFKQHIASS